MRCGHGFGCGCGNGHSHDFGCGLRPRLWLRLWLRLRPRLRLCPPPPPRRGRDTAGLECVMTGRAKALPDFAIGNKVADLDRNKLLKIGTTPTYALRRQLQEMITERYEGVDRPRVKAKIAAVDRAKTKTYEGGCRFLRKWYREKFWSRPATRPDD